MLYTPNADDTVCPEEGIPRPDAGAPMPFVAATEERLLLAYYGDFFPRSPDGVPVIVNPVTPGSVVVVDFKRPHSYFSVPLSNETLHAHPLVYRGRGLYRYGAYRVDSSWIRRLISAQYVHPRPLPGVYKDSRH
jgi:hypothetical protein